MFYIGKDLSEEKIFSNVDEKFKKELAKKPIYDLVYENPYVNEGINILIKEEEMKKMEKVNQL
jgi:hypothetical protein